MIDRETERRMDSYTHKDASKNALQLFSLYEKSNNPYIIYNCIYPKNTSISKNLETKKYENLTKV